MFFKKPGIIIFLSITLLLVPFFIIPVEAAQLIWIVETVDAALQVGHYTSIALDSNDRPQISYYDFYWNDLKLARWNTNQWLNFPYVNVGDVGAYSSFALDSNDDPHMSYYDADGRNLMYYYYYTPTETSYIEITIPVDTTGDVGAYTSLALDSNENPHISYYDVTNGDLKYAIIEGSTCTTETVDSTGDVGSYSSLALDSNNNAHIIYYDATNHDLKYARWTGTAWTTEIVDSTGNVGAYASLALDSNNNPHTSYFDGYPNNNLKYAKKTGTSWTIETVDASKDVGRYTSIAIDSSNYPHISYYDNNWGDLKYAKMTNSGWLVKNVDNVGDVGGYTSIVLDSNNHPHISYFDWDNNNLKYAKDPDETINSLFYDAFDSNGDLQNDGVKFSFDIDTTFSATLPVYVYAYLTDNIGNLWATNNTLISITSDQTETNDLIVTLPQNAPQDTYNAYLVVEDDRLTVEDFFTISVSLYPPVTSQIGTLQGTVTDVQTGDPISFADIQINGYTTYTNSSGQYSIDLPDGTYSITADELQYASQIIPGVTIIANITTTQDIQLQRSHYILEIQSEGSGTLNPTTGTYSHLVGSEIEVQAIADPGWTLAYWFLDLANVGSENPYNVTMESNHVLKAVFLEESQIGYLQGTVTDFDSGAPLGEIEIIVGDSWFLTNSTGNYALELEAGEYNMIVGGFDYQFQEMLVTITTGSTTVQDFILEKIPRNLIIEVIGSGTTNPSPGEQLISSGTEIFIEGIPNEGWSLNHWILDSVNIGSENPILVAMDSDHVLAAVFTEGIQVEPLIESCDVVGSSKNVFDLGEVMYLNGSFFSSSTTFPLYVVNDIATWVDGMSLPSRIPETEPAISSDADGNILPTIIWNNLQMVGNYDIIVDVNANGQYDSGIDALDDGDIEVTAGVQIIPEGSSAIILLILVSTTLFALIINRKQLFHSHSKNT